MPGIPPGIRRALRLPSNEERLAHELDDEVAFHLQQRAAELIARGLSEDDARREALRRFGDAADLRAYAKSIEVSHMRRLRLHEWWESWRHDMRYALRQFTRAPGFFTIATLTLGLGIGASASIFSVVRGVLLRPLPYPDPERIVQLWQVSASGQQTQFSDPNFDDLRAQSRSFTALAEMVPAGIISVSGTSEPVRAQGAFVSRDFFDVMGVRPLRGRLFDDSERQENGGPAVLVTEAFWRRHLDASEAAIGKTLQFDGKSFSVIGILPALLDFPTGSELWMPRELQPRYTSRTAQNWQVVGRLAKGVTIDRANREVSAIAKRLKQQYGEDTFMEDAAVVSLQQQIVGRSTSTLIVLMVGSLVLLLIACANVVNLLIARMAAKQGEVAVRVALGAGRGRLAQQCLAESLVLAVAAGAMGVVLARIGVRVLLAMQPGNLPRVQDVRVDWQVLVFAIVVSMAAALVMGFVTAWRGTRGDVREALSQSQRTQGGSLSSERVRRGLVVTQMALAVVLLVATGLFARSFIQLLSVDPGFRSQRQVVLDLLPYGTRSERVALYDRLFERFREIPGVIRAGGVNVMPLSGTTAGDGTFVIMRSVDERVDSEGFEALMRDKARTGEAEFRVASPGYFDAMGIPLRQGRFLEERDVMTAPHAAVISVSLARIRWPNENPIGKIIQFGNMDGDMRPFTIVGVVGDVHETSLASEPRPTFYASYRQRPGQAWRFNFVLSTSGDPAATIRAMRRIVRDTRPDLPPRIRTIDTIVSGSIADRRFVLSLVAAFGVAALVLAALGVYSVISYLVAQRSRELSIRVALGAKSSDILRLVLRQGLLLALTGILVGAAVSYGATRLIANMLYGVQATDPIAFVAVMLGLSAVAVLASWVPARRASRVHAMEVLRIG